MLSVPLSAARPQSWWAGVYLVFFLGLVCMPGRPQGSTPGVDRQSIIDFLNQSIVWHRQVDAQQQSANEPSDALFVNQSRSLADQAIRFSFDFAHARAQTLPDAGTAVSSSEAGATPDTVSRHQSLVAAAAKA